MKWRPINTADQDYTNPPVLLWESYYGVGSYYIGSWSDGWIVDGIGYIKPSHWLPLPRGPKREIKQSRRYRGNKL